jgi:amino acid transporter
MSTTVEGKQKTGALRAGAIGAPALVFLVMAFQAPLTSAAGNVPFVVGLGNGVGAPGMFVVCGIVLSLFAVAFAAMSRRITNAGAFYAYVAAGINRPAGTAAGWIALFTYNVLLLVPVAYAGYFGNYVFQAELGIGVPWQVFSFGVLVLIWMVGMRGIEVNTILLGIFLILEVSILVLTVVAVLFKHGFAAASFAPSEVFSGNFGIAFMFALLSFIGFEATAVFGEETKNPKRTVARATYAAVWTIVILYALSTWAAVSIHPAGDVAAIAADNPGDFVSTAAVFGLGAWAGHAFNWLLIVSIIACCMAVHNMASRYLFAFGRDGLLPGTLGKTHPRFETPYVASTVQFVLMLLAVGACAVAGADPYAALGGLSGGFATLGVVLLMAVMSIAAIRFLRSTDESVWVRLIAPGLAFLGLAAGVVIIVFNFDALAGQSTVSNLLPWMFLVIAALGYAHGVIHSSGKKYAEPV